jgi:hypothetical protein
MVRGCDIVVSASVVEDSDCSDERKESSGHRYLITNSYNSLYAYTPSMCLGFKLSESVQGYI